MGGRREIGREGRLEGWLAGGEERDEREGRWGMGEGGDGGKV